MWKRVRLSVLVLLGTLICCASCGWAAEHVIVKTASEVISVPEAYANSDTFVIRGASLERDDWNELKKRQQEPFYLVLENGQTEIPDKALGNDGAPGAALLSIKAPLVVTIGADAFMNCTFLASMDMPLVERIGEMAFFSCGNIKSVELPKGLAELGDGAFGFCKLLTDISLASGNENFKVEGGALYSADGSKLCLYPAGRRDTSFTSRAREIRPFAFYGAIHLESVTVASALSIGNGAFIACGGLQEVDIQEGVEKIGNGAFDSCRKLRTVRFPASLKEIGSGIFSYCNALTEVVVEPGGEAFKTEDGILYSADGNTICVYPAARPARNFRSPVASVYPYGFIYSGNLVTVTLPEAIEIGGGAFAWSENIRAVAIPSAYTVGNGAFALCTGLKLVVLGAQKPEIEENSFLSVPDGLLIAVPDTAGYEDLTNWPKDSAAAKLIDEATLGPVALNEGDRVALSLHIEGATDYQWKRNGAAIEGATGPAYTKERAAAEDGGVYGVTFRYEMPSGPATFDIDGIEVTVAGGASSAQATAPTDSTALPAETDAPAAPESGLKANFGAIALLGAVALIAAVVVSRRKPVGKHERRR